MIGIEEENISRFREGTRISKHYRQSSEIPMVDYYFFLITCFSKGSCSIYVTLQGNPNWKLNRTEILPPANVLPFQSQPPFKYDQSQRGTFI